MSTNTETFENVSPDERNAFLKEFAKDPKQEYETVAGAVGIPPSDAFKYAVFFANTVIEKRENVWDVHTVLNQGVAQDNEISTEEINKLREIVTDFVNLDFEFSSSGMAAEVKPKGTEEEPKEKVYPDIFPGTKQNYKSTQSGQPVEKKMSVNQDTSQTVNNNNSIPKKPTTPSLQELRSAAKTADEITSNPKFESNIDVMSWIVDELPFVQDQKKEGFLKLFKQDLRTFMMNPDSLFQFCLAFLGENTGRVVFERFKSMIRPLGNEQQFGYDPYRTNFSSGYGGYQGFPQPPGFGQQQYGQQGYNPSLGYAHQQKKTNPVDEYWKNLVLYYQAQGDIPPFIDPESDAAKKMAFEMQSKEKKKKEREERMEEMQENFQMMMQTQMSKMFDPSKMGGGGGGDNNMMMMMMMAGYSPVPTVDSAGNQTMRWEKTGGNSNGVGDTASLLSSLSGIYDTIIKNATSGNSFTQDIMKQWIEKNMNQDPMENIIKYKDYVSEFIPKQPSFTENVEALRIMMDSDRMKQDYNMAGKYFDYRVKKEEEERQQQLHNEEKSKENASSTIKNIFSVGKDFLLPLFSILMAMKGGQGFNPQALLGALGGSGMQFPGMETGNEQQEAPPGAGAPNFFQQNPGNIGQPVTNNQSDEEVNTKWLAPKSDIFGYTNESVESQPVEDNQTQNNTIYDTDSYTEVKNYDVDQFLNAPLEVLQDYERRSGITLTNAYNYHDVITKAIAVKSGKPIEIGNSGGQSEEIEGQDQFSTPIEVDNEGKTSVE